MARKLEIMENEKQALDELKNDEITKKREKCQMHTEGPGIWRGKLKRWKIQKCTLQDVEHGKKTENHGK